MLWGVYVGAPLTISLGESISALLRLTNIHNTEIPHVFLDNVVDMPVGVYTLSSSPTLSPSLFTLTNSR